MMKQIFLLFVLTTMISATLRQADRSKQLIGKWQFHYTIQKRGNQIDTNFQVDEHGHQCGAVITFNGDGTGTLDFGFGNVEKAKWDYRRADNSVHYQVYLDTNVVGHKLLIQVGGKKKTWTANITRPGGIVFSVSAAMNWCSTSRPITPRCSGG